MNPLKERFEDETFIKEKYVHFYYYTLTYKGFDQVDVLNLVIL